MARAFPDLLNLPAATGARGHVTLPGSKSISNRTLLLAALARGDTRLVGLLDADDVDRMRDALTTLGVALHDVPGDALVVEGRDGRFPVTNAELFLGNAGTAFRPLTAALALAGGDYTLKGVPRMHERPIGDLVDALRMLGADIRCLAHEGYPPLAIAPFAPAAAIPARVPIRGSVSSQFLSALLMALPLATARAGHAISVEVVGALISRPYVVMTTKLMARFGVGIASPDPTQFVVPGDARYRSPGTVHVEGDASGASYFLAAGVLGGGPVRVHGVDRESIQGDIAFADVLERLGAHVTWGAGWVEARGAGPVHGGSIDCVAIPDAAMTLAVVALFAREPTTLTGIASWRVKETDRIAAMATELTKLGASVASGDDWLRIVPPRGGLNHAAIDTYDDHRMAMCFALVSVAGTPVRIHDPGCVSKTYPDFFEALAGLTAGAAREPPAPELRVPDGERA